MHTIDRLVAVDDPTGERLPVAGEALRAGNIVVLSPSEQGFTATRSNLDTGGVFGMVLRDCEMGKPAEIAACGAWGAVVPSPRVWAVRAVPRNKP